MTYTAPVDEDQVLAFVVRQVPGIRYAAPLLSASEAEDSPSVTWSSFDGQTVNSYQTNLGSTYSISIHVGARTRSEAKRLAGLVWAAVNNAPEVDTSEVAGVRIVASRTNDVPVENRTAGQLLNYYEFRWTAYLTVSRKD